jgi:hypothetical protein
MLCKQNIRQTRASMEVWGSGRLTHRLQRIRDRERRIGISQRRASLTYSCQSSTYR